MSGIGKTSYTKIAANYVTLATEQNFKFLFNLVSMVELFQPFTYRLKRTWSLFENAFWTMHGLWQKVPNKRQARNESFSESMVHFRVVTVTTKFTRGHKASLSKVSVPSTELAFAKRCNKKIIRICNFTQQRTELIQEINLDFN